MKLETLSLDDLRHEGLEYLQMCVLVGYKPHQDKIVLSTGTIKGGFSESGEVYVHKDGGKGYEFPELIIGDRDKRENLHRAFVDTPENRDYLKGVVRRNDIEEYCKLIGIDVALARRQLRQMRIDAGLEVEEAKHYVVH